jgi:hypothetical protein
MLNLLTLARVHASFWLLSASMVCAGRGVPFAALLQAAMQQKRVLLLNSGGPELDNLTGGSSCLSVQVTGLQRTIASLEGQVKDMRSAELELQQQLKATEMELGKERNASAKVRPGWHHLSLIFVLLCPKPATQALLLPEGPLTPI